MENKTDILIGFGAWLNLPGGNTGICKSCDLEGLTFKIAGLISEYTDDFCINCIESFFSKIPASFKFKYCRKCNCILFGEYYYHDQDKNLSKSCAKCEDLEFLKELSQHKPKDPKQEANKVFNEMLKNPKIKKALKNK